MKKSLIVLIFLFIFPISLGGVSINEVECPTKFDLAVKKNEKGEFVSETFGEYYEKNNFTSEEKGACEIKRNKINKNTKNELKKQIETVKWISNIPLGPIGMLIVCIGGLFYFLIRRK